MKQIACSYHAKVISHFFIIYETREWCSCYDCELGNFIESILDVIGD